MHAACLVFQQFHNVLHSITFAWITYDSSLFVISKPVTLIQLMKQFICISNYSVSLALFKRVRKFALCKSKEDVCNRSKWYLFVSYRKIIQWHQRWAHYGIHRNGDCDSCAHHIGTVLHSAWEMSETSWILCNSIIQASSLRFLIVENVTQFHETPSGQTPSSSHLPYKKYTNTNIPACTAHSVESFTVELMILCVQTTGKHSKERHSIAWIVFSGSLKLSPSKPHSPFVWAIVKSVNIQKRRKLDTSLFT